MESEKIEYKRVFENIEKIFNNPIDYIYEECCEFRRVIQLNKEELIMNIKQSNGIHLDMDENEIQLKILSKIYTLNNECDQIIDSINAYEKDAISNIESNKLQFIKEFDEFKRIYLNLESFVELNELRNYSGKLGKFLDKFRIKVFNNKIMELKTSDRAIDRLKYYLYYREELDLEETEFFSKKFRCFKKKDFFGKDISSIVFNVLENGKYFMLITRKFYAQELVIIDMIKNCFKKLAYSNEYIHEFSVYNNLIYITCSNLNSMEHANTLVIFNDKLEIVKDHKANGSYIFVSRCKPFRICELNYDGILRIFDSSMNLILNGTHQPTNKSEQFYLRFAKHKFEYSNNKYYFFDSEGTVKIFDTKGFLINMFRNYSAEEFKVDLKGNIVIYIRIKEMVEVYDENGLALKKIHLNFFDEDYIVNQMRFFIDPKTNKYILNCSFRLFYFSS